MLIIRSPHSFLLAALSGVLVFLSFPNYNIFFLEWFAFIPLLYSIRNRSLRESYILGVVAGTVTISGGYPWGKELVQQFIGWPFPLYHLGVPIYAFITAQIFGAICLSYKWLTQKESFFEILIFPTIFVALWSIYPMLFPFQLSAGQMSFLPVVQPIDITGGFGLDFVILLCNSALFHLLTKGSKSNYFLLSFSFLIVIGWIITGFVKYNTWDENVKTWKQTKIGIVQPNRAATFAAKKTEQGYSLVRPWELVKTIELAEQGAKIIIWPEGHDFSYDYEIAVKNSFHHTMKKLNAHLIFEDGTRERINGKIAFHRTVTWIDKKGIFKGYSHKTVLVPFGEYIPFQKFLSPIAAKLGFHFLSLTPGDGPKIFEPEQMKVIPFICYESIFSSYVAEAVGRVKKGQVIINVSQDGWYGNSLQQVKQHSMLTNMRAIENRVPLIHVIVNGPSYVITPHGKVEFESGHMTRGAWLADVSHSPESGGSFYTRNPKLFIYSIWGVLALMLLLRMLEEKQLLKNKKKRRRIRR